MAKNNLIFLQSQLTFISGFQKGNVEKIDKLLNDKTVDELNEIKSFHFKDEVSLIKYLKRPPQKDFNDYCLAPVNFLRYRIYQELSVGNKLDISSFFENFEKSLLTKRIKSDDLPMEIVELFNRNGWGSSNDPYHNWKDFRKLVYDYVLSPTNYGRMMSELDLLSETFKEKLNFVDCNINIKGPWGSQNNSFDDHCWIAWCPGNTMKKTVHLGLRIYSDHFLTLLYIGDDFYKEREQKDQSLREEIFFNLEDALSWLFSLKDKCIELNDNEEKVRDEIQYIKFETDELKADLFTPKRTPARDSLGLHTGSYRSTTRKSTDIESSYLYLYKVEGIKIESKDFKGSGIFKIGMSSDPYVRKLGIIKGFGLSSLLSIKKIFIKKNMAKYESNLKDYIDCSPEFYYDGEFFCTPLTDKEVKALIEKELNRLKKV